MGYPHSKAQGDGGEANFRARAIREGWRYIERTGIGSDYFVVIRNGWWYLVDVKTGGAHLTNPQKQTREIVGQTHYREFHEPMYFQEANILGIQMGNNLMKSFSLRKPRQVKLDSINLLMAYGLLENFRGHLIVKSDYYPL